MLGRPPAEADLQRHFGVTPPSVHQMVLTLERAGLIRGSLESPAASKSWSLPNSFRCCVDGSAARLRRLPPGFRATPAPQRQGVRFRRVQPISAFSAGVQRPALRAAAACRGFRDRRRIVVARPIKPARLPNYEILPGLLAIYLVGLVIGLLVFRHRVDAASLLALNSSFPNMAFMGIPVLTAVIGPSAVLPSANPASRAFKAVAADDEPPLGQRRLRFECSEAARPDFHQ